MTSTAYVQVHTKTLYMKEIVSNTLIGLLIRNHKFRTGSETFINPVKLFNVFLQVKINTFLPIHEKNIVFMHYTRFFYVFFFSRKMGHSMVCPTAGDSLQSKQINVQCEKY